MKMSKILTLEYNLAELPSSQHRAGLAGLVLMVDWLRGEFEKDQIDAEKVICRRIDLGETRAAFEMNKDGYKFLFDKVYGYFRKAEEKDKKPEGKTAKFTEKIVDGKISFTQFILQPQGAFLADYDPTNQANDGIWIKLWRDMFFQVIRPDYHPKHHFNNREEGKVNKDETELWKNLQTPPKEGTSVKHSLFLTAVEKNAEDVPFIDQPRLLLLLHFWVFIAQIYVPATAEYDKKKKKFVMERIGYSLTVPDVSNLKVFCAKFPDKILRQRGAKAHGYFKSLPEESLVDIAAEGALDFMHKLNKILPEEVSEIIISRVLFGIDVFHLKKKSKGGVDIINTSRINPSYNTDKYATIKRNYQDYFFRRQRMLNFLNDKDWFYGFDLLLSKTDTEQTFGNSYFGNDVRKAFEDIGVTNKLKGANNMETTAAEVAPKTIEAITYDLVSSYIREKLGDKYQLKWSDVKGKSKEEDEYNEKKGKIAREAFLAIRNQADKDFVKYFASTLCLYHQFSLKGDGFNLIAQALYNKEKVCQLRTLTMLALSANGYSPKSDKQGETK